MISSKKYKQTNNTPSRQMKQNWNSRVSQKMAFAAPKPLLVPKTVTMSRAVTPTRSTDRSLKLIDHYDQRPTPKLTTTQSPTSVNQKPRQDLSNSRTRTPVKSSEPLKLRHGTSVSPLRQSLEHLVANQGRNALGTIVRTPPKRQLNLQNQSSSVSKEESQRTNDVLQTLFGQKCLKMQQK